MGKRGMRKATGMTREERIAAAIERERKTKEEQHEKNIEIAKRLIGATLGPLPPVDWKKVSEDTPTGVPDCLCLKCANVDEKSYCEYWDEHCDNTKCTECKTVRKTCSDFKPEE